MDTFWHLKDKNAQITWIHVDSPEFKSYGRVIEIDSSIYLKAVEEELLNMDTSRVVYKASVPELEKLNVQNQELSDKVYGQMPIQVGYCYGYNSTMNAMEWHHGSEVNITGTDTVLLLATFDKVEQERGEPTFNSKETKAVFIPKGYAVEIYSMILHFAPIQVNEKGFFTLVILPKGTNSPLESETKDDYLVATNKWLITHPDMKRGNGIVGENIKILY